MYFLKYLMFSSIEETDKKFKENYCTITNTEYFYIREFNNFEQDFEDILSKKR